MKRSVDVRVDVIRNGAVLCQLLPDGAPRVRCRSGSAIKTSFQGTFKPDARVDWLRDELRPVLILDGLEYPLGVFLPATVSPTGTETAQRIDVEAYDRCWRVQSTRAETLLHLAAGTNYIDAIKSLLTAAGIALVVSTPTSSTLAFDREDWEIGESYLTVIDQLLDEINYAPLRFDAAGYAVLEPERTVDASQVVRTYNINDGSCRLLREASAKLDLYNAPNVFICVCSNVDGSGPLVSVAENNVPSSPLSIVRRGRRIATTVKVRNIADQSALDDYAQLLCQDGMLLGSTVTITTGLMQGLAPDAVVALVHPTAEGICRETEWQIDLEPGGTMSHKLQRMVTTL